MQSVSEFQVTYTPGAGYIAKPSDSPNANVSVGWGEELQAKLKEHLTRQAAEARQNMENFKRTKLTGTEVSELARKYNPKRMTQEEYDQFLENLVEKGVLSRQEIGYLGYQGRTVVSVDNGYLEDCTGYSMAQIFQPDRLNLFGLYSMDGDALSWSKLMSLRTSGTNNGAMYAAILDVLERMWRTAA